MELTVKERILMGLLYPQQGNIQTQLIIRDIETKVRITDEEGKEINLKAIPTGEGVTWDIKKATIKNIEFTSTEMAFLKDQVSRLDKENKVTSKLLDLCLKIKDAK